MTITRPVSAAASIVRGGDMRVSNAILALGGVGRVPLLVSAAANLAATIPGEEEISAVAEAAEAAADPSDDQRGSARYKKAMAREWSVRVLRACLDTEPRSVPSIMAGQPRRQASAGTAGAQ
jgi:CO/xanthine dehydrogenase FAD-binding subunit